MFPRVSIIIPVYNAETYLSDTLKSALEQDYENLEIVAVNDGSRDKSPTILESWKDPQLKVIHQENQGQCAASNAGIRHSSGELIKFLDQDDLINPGHISAQVAALNGRKDSVACCRWVYFRDGLPLPSFQSRITDRDYDDPLGWIEDNLNRDMGMMGVWQWLIPRSILEKAGGWDEQISLENDFDLTIRVLMTATGIRFAPDAIVYYRTGIPTSLSAERSRKAWESVLLATKKGTDALLKCDSGPDMQRLCANRFQKWLYQMYPAHKDLAKEAEVYVHRLGGSDLKLKGGRILQSLNRILNWKQVRWLQHYSYLMGWKWILKTKMHRFV